MIVPKSPSDPANSERENLNGGRVSSVTIAHVPYQTYGFIYLYDLFAMRGRGPLQEKTGGINRIQ